MLAQGDFGETGPAIAFLVGAAVAFLPGARGITWLVDRVRDALPKMSADPRFKILWPILALVFALIICFGFEVNIVGSLQDAVPGLKGASALDGWFGQLLTALALAGAASSWHDRDVAKNPSTTGG